MPPLFVVQQQLKHGVTNPIVARLSVQTLDILRQCDIEEDTRSKIEAIYTTELLPTLLRCWEIQRRLQAEYDKCVASYKPPASGDVSVELPQILSLEQECRDFVYEAKNYLRDLLKVFNLLYGTDFKEGSEWARAAKKSRQSVMEFVAATFGAGHANTTYFEQMPTCILPYVDMRNAVDHPNGYSGQPKITNFTFDAQGTLTAPVWSREKDGKAIYGPLPILREMEVGVHNLMVLGEDVAIMWALAHLSMPGITEVTVVPESSRNPQCPIKYRVTPSAAVLNQLANLETRKANR